MIDQFFGSVDPVRESLVVSSRDALAKAIEENAQAFEGVHFDHEWDYHDDAENLADALLASGVVRVLPDEETVTRAIARAKALPRVQVEVPVNWCLDDDPSDKRQTEFVWAEDLQETARAVLALFKQNGGEK